MRISTYFAATLPQAMAQVREALGPKAIILSWRNTRGGVEISASVASGADAPTQQEPQPNPIMPTPLVHKTEDRLSDHFSADELALDEAPPTKRATQPVLPQRGLAALVKRQPSQIKQPVTIAPQRPQTPPLANKPTAPRLPVGQPIQAHNPLSRLHAFLVRAGLNAHQAHMFGTSATPELARALTDCLGKALRFEPIEAVPPKPLILVGPPGSGKSSCAAKLAARTLTTNHEVLLISADSERCGGADQLRALATRLGARFEAVTTVVDLNDLVAQARQRGMVVIVDAPSACPAQPADMRATARMIAETRLEAVLCLPSDMRPDDMEELATAYQAIGIKRAIGTRLDLTSRRASLLYALQQADIALAQISATPYISGGVAMASASRLSALLLEPFEDALAEDAA
jgi:flagellar biosynthesis protein FlhF